MVRLCGLLLAVLPAWAGATDHGRWLDAYPQAPRELQLDVGYTAWTPGQSEVPLALRFGLTDRVEVGLALAGLQSTRATGFAVGSGTEAGSTSTRALSSVGLTARALLLGEEGAWLSAAAALDLNGERADASFDALAPMRGAAGLLAGIRGELFLFEGAGWFELLRLPARELSPAGRVLFTAETGAGLTLRASPGVAMGPVAILADAAVVTTPGDRSPGGGARYRRFDGVTLGARARVVPSDRFLLELGAQVPVGALPGTTAAASDLSDDAELDHARFTVRLGTDLPF